MNQLNVNRLTDADAAKLLWDRWMHLEKLLVTTLFAMFVTTTIGLFAAAGKVQAGARVNPAHDTLLLLGAAAAYGVLSGYYYFMLAQNYAAMVSLLGINRHLIAKTSALWEFFMPRSVAIGSVLHQALLLPAAAVPLLITLLSLVGLRIVLRNDHPIAFWASIAGHVILFFAMIWVPFRLFVMKLREVMAQPGAEGDAVNRAP